MAPARMSAAPRHSTTAVHRATVTVTMGESNDFTRRAASAAFTVAWLTSLSSSCSVVFSSEGLDDPHGLQALLHHGDDFRLFLAHLVRRFLHRLLESRHEEQQEGGHRDRDQGEVPVQPEHQTEHGDDGQQVNQNVQGGGGGKTLDGLDVGGHRAQQVAGLVGIVVAEREALQMMIGAHPQIVGHPLPDALGVVVVNVGGDRAEHGNHHERQRRQSGDLQLAAAVQHGPDQVVQPGLTSCGCRRHCR